MKKLLPFTFALCATAFATQAQAKTFYNCAALDGGVEATCKKLKTKKQKNSYTQTKYPVVLGHGLGGWSSIGGFINYFHAIPEYLMAGGTQVFATKVAAVNSTEFRGEQLLRQVQTITAITGKEKVNLIGHSHGGIDIRYVAAHAPEKVASVTAVSSPEHGTAFADFVKESILKNDKKAGLGEGEHTFAANLAIKLMETVGKIVDLGSGIKYEDLTTQESWASLESLSTDGAKKFNQQYPAAMASRPCVKPRQHYVNGVSYYSWTGTQEFTNVFDPLDYVMALTGLSFKGAKNDGLVSQCSSYLGKVIRDNYRMNHADTINQAVGIVSWRETNPKVVYRNHVNRLKNQGY